MRCRIVGWAVLLLALATVLSTAIASQTVAHPGRHAVAPGFDDCSHAAWCPTMIPVPAGTFTMGSPADEPGRFDDEGPQRRLHIRRFAVGKFPVTRGEWAAFVHDTKRAIVEAPCAYAPGPHPSWQDIGFAQTDDDPVVCITWGEAQEYARWLSARTGHHYRLLTEAEWEYAARGGSTTAFPWGAVADHEHANYGMDACCGPRVLGRDAWANTSPVGSFPPNAFGLYDMHGNVFEWVQDCHAHSYAGLPSDGSAFETNHCSQRVARGGVYADTWKLMRSAARNFAPPDDTQSIATYRSAGFGLRVARDVP